MDKSTSFLKNNKISTQRHNDTELHSEKKILLPTYPVFIFDYNRYKNIYSKIFG